MNEKAQVGLFWVWIKMIRKQWLWLFVLGYFQEPFLCIQAIKAAAGHDVAHFDTALSFIPLTDVLIKGKDWLFSANALKVEK